MSSHISRGGQTTFFLLDHLFFLCHRTFRSKKSWIWEQKLNPQILLYSKFSVLEKMNFKVTLSLAIFRLSLFTDLWQSDSYKKYVDHSNLAVSCGVMELWLQSLCIHCQRNLAMALGQFIDLDALGRCLVSFVGLLWNSGGGLLKINFGSFECENLNNCMGRLFRMSRSVFSFSLIVIQSGNQFV